MVRHQYSLAGRVNTPANSKTLPSAHEQLNLIPG